MQPRSRPVTRARLLDAALAEVHGSRISYIKASERFKGEAASMTVGFIVGLVFVGAGVYGFRQNRRMSRGGGCVSGVIVDVRSQKSYSSGRYTHIPVVAFQTLDGQDIRTEVGGGPGIPTRLGLQVPVVYDPGHPNIARINTTAGRATWLPFVFIAAGIAITCYDLFTVMK